MRERWIAVVVAMFGAIFLMRALIIHSALAPIPPGTWPPAEVVAEVERLQRYLWVVFVANVALGLVTFGVAAGIALQKSWTAWLWVGTAFAILIMIAGEMIAMQVGWAEYLVEFAFAAMSLYHNRHVFLRGNRAL